MNKTLLSTLFIMVALTGTLNADMSCLDNSHHLQQKYDHKEYYLVKDCLCPCEKKYKIYPGRGQCSKCGHYRVPRPLVIVNEKNNQ